MSPTCRLPVPNNGLGKADSKLNVVLAMSKVRTCKTSELVQVANSVVGSPKPIVPENFYRAWADMRVPRLLNKTGSWCWERELCTVYDERLVTLPITGFIMIPRKPRYIDPDLEEDLREATATCEKWYVICARRALKLGLVGRLGAHRRRFTPTDQGAPRQLQPCA